MKIKTSELTGPALDWAVATAEGALRPLGNVVVEGKRLWIEVACNPFDRENWDVEYTPSTDWAQGGPIIEREGIELKRGLVTPFVWAAFAFRSPRAHCCGPTPLIAAMRCFVTFKLGVEVDVPKELL